MTEKSLTVYSLFSGSTGNCTYFRAGDTEFLIDAGVCAGSIARALNEIGTDLSHIAAVLVTHEHSDHVKGLAVLCKKYHTPVHMTLSSAEHFHADDAVRACMQLHPPFCSLAFEDCTVQSFPVPHDSACCVGYRITCGTHTVTVATDLGCVTKEILSQFLGAEGVILESNHDVAMLLQNPCYPAYLKERILSSNGHLSNELASRFLSYLAENGTHYALLAHLSRDNNTPELALSAIRSRLTVPLTVSAAPPDGVVRLM